MADNFNFVNNVKNPNAIKGVNNGGAINTKSKALQSGKVLFVNNINKKIVASPAGGGNKEKNQNLSISLSSLVLKTSTRDCSLNAGSLDQIAELIDNASAKNGISLSCINCLACSLKDSNSSEGIILICNFNCAKASFPSSEKILYSSTSLTSAPGYAP